MIARSSTSATGAAAPAAQYFVGIDVSKRWLDLADTAGRRLRVDNNPAAIARALADKGWRGCAAMVCEATGGYERALMRAASALGLPLRRVHPNRVHGFARARPGLAKTDALDARLLADFARFTAGEEAHALPSPRQQELAEMVSRLDQLKGQRHAEACRAKQAEGALVKASIQAMLAFVEAEIAALQEAVAAMIAADPALARTAALLRTCKGVGPRLAEAILAWLPEIGTLGRRRVAALVGVAPITRRSGSSIDAARIKGGRKPLRDILFMAALTASRHNATFKTVYERLRGGGKPHKVALIAVARKLLVTLNAMARTQTAFAPRDRPAADRRGG